MGTPPNLMRDMNCSAAAASSGDTSFPSSSRTLFLASMYSSISPKFGSCKIKYTLQSLYNTFRYNTVLDITRFKDGSQKCIPYST